MKTVKLFGHLYEVGQGFCGTLILSPLKESPETLHQKRKWANEVLAQHSGEFHFLEKGRATYAFSKENSVTHGFDGEYWGVAMCNANDKADGSIGRAIAITRALGEDVPEFIFE